jgi:hypothetical protein
MNMKKGQFVKVINDRVKAEMTFAEVLFGGGTAPAFEGKLLEVNPTPEQFAQHDENFKACFEAGEAIGVERGVIYFDEKANRAFWLLVTDVEVVTVN